MQDDSRLFQQFVGELEKLPSSKRFSAEELEAVYALARGMYVSGRFEEALGYFGYLTLYRPTEPRYLLGLAASQQMARRLEAAIQTYSFLTLLDPNDPEPTLHVGECFMFLGQLAEARDAFTLVVAMANVSGEKHAALKSRAEGLMQAIGRAKAEAPAAAD